MPSAEPRDLPPRATLLLLLLCGGLLLFRLGAIPLMGPDEPRYARVAVEMARRGDLVRPTLQGEPWLEKPVLFYWLAGGATKALGETEVAVRLPSVAAALLLIGTVTLVGARLFGRAAGLHAGFVIGTSLLTFAYGRAAAMDMLLAATVTAAIGLLVLRLQGVNGPGAVLVAYGFVGLALLAKGPLGLLLPILVIGSAVALHPAPRPWRAVISPGAILVMALVAATWYVPILLDQGRTFVDVFIIGHNLDRFTSTVHRHPGSPLYYVPILLAGLFPWSGLLVPALATLAPRRSLLDRQVLLWLAAPLVFFSAAGSKLPGYILPCLPPLALLTGRAAAQLVAGGEAARFARATALVGLTLAAVVACAPFALFRIGEPQWSSTAPLAVWVLVMGLTVSRRLNDDPAGALRGLRIGAAGALLLLAIVAPPIVERRESGRSLFAPAQGRDVLAWGAWRTAWMSGYFYNDGRVREVEGMPAVAEAARNGTTHVLCGPAECRLLEAAPGLRAERLAEGPRGNALLAVSAR